MPEKPEIRTTDYVDVAKRSEELGCNIPTGLAVLPRNFSTAASKTDLVHEDTTPTLRALWMEKGITETRLEREGEHFPYIEENSFEWVGPVILIGSAVYSQSPHVISITLNVLSNYLTDFFKGRVGKNTAKLSVVVPDPRSHRFTKIDYDGPVEGIKEIEAVIKAVRSGRRLK